MTLQRLALRLLSKAVRQPNGCLTVGSGRRYWSVLYNGRRSNAHRAAWEFYHGPIPDGMEVCHSCDNGLCIEREHLWLGTHWENMQDRNRKGHVRKSNLVTA